MTQSPEPFDAIVIGSGPGGYVAAIRAAQLGMRTAVVERDHVLGGRCLRWACIPAKITLRSADILSELRDASAFGIMSTPATVDFGVVAARRREVISKLAGGVAHLMKRNDIEVVKASATVGPGRVVTAGGRTLIADVALILATGSSRRPVPGIEFGGRVIGTEEAWSMDSLPGNLAVLGAGASGAEVASAYARLGAHVRLLEREDRVLPTEEPEISSIVQSKFTSQGIDVRTQVRLVDVRDEADHVTFTDDGVQERVECLVVAAGRAPDLGGLLSDQCDVARTPSGMVAVDGLLRTSAEGVFAIGDLVDGPALAHKASEEGVIAVETAAGNTVAPLSSDWIPRATFCEPNVASVGLTESAARAAGYDVTVGRVPFSAIGAAAVYGDTTGMVKIIGDRSLGCLLGAHVVGVRATDLIQQFVTLHSMEGGYEDLARTIHSHPTISEIVLEAARAADGWQIHG